MQQHHTFLPETATLFPGIELSYFAFFGERLHIPHEMSDNTLHIVYCRQGRIGRVAANGHSVCLGAGDFSIFTAAACADNTVFLPNGSCEGLSLSVRLNILTQQLPELLTDTGIGGTFLYQKYCLDKRLTSIAACAQSNAVFEHFYLGPDSLRPAYRRIGALETLLYLSCVDPSQEEHLTQLRPEQVDIARRIHRRLTENLAERITIEELSREFLMNPTTLKEIFKSVYGNSVAAHVREHRLNHAAQLLKSSRLSLAEIAASVGYTSQSKFSAAFKEQFHVLPKEYKKGAWQPTNLCPDEGCRLQAEASEND